MKQTAYIASKLLFYLYLSLYIFIMIFSILSYFEYKFGIQIPFGEIVENRPKVLLPTLRLILYMPLNYAILITCTRMSFYPISFYAFKEFLRVFVEKNMFEVKSLKRLKFFLILNLIPLIYIILFTASFLIKGSAFRLEDDYFIVFAHLVIAFLLYLYLDIVKKGKRVQEENDLTI